MSTRCNVVVKDGYQELWFYRHHDGYPESILPDLEPVMQKLRYGKLRDNASQFAGWLIVKGNEDYYTSTSMSGWQSENFGWRKAHHWKVGNYEPTTKQHGDVDFVYEIDLTSKNLEVREA